MSQMRVGDYPPPEELVPVTVLTGFLGSGKTTLLNHILTADHGKRIAVIENEFGEVGIDDALVKSKFQTEEDLFEMNNGCICCTIRVDLITILSKLAKRQEAGNKLDHIIIETTGLADPAPVAQTFFVDDNVKRFARLDSIVTLVDAKHVEEHLDEVKPEGVENEAVEQVAFADLLLLNKIDLVEEESELKRLEGRLRALNQWAPITRCQNAAVGLDSILNLRGFELDRVLELDPGFLDVDGEHVHDDRVSSVGFHIDGELDMHATNNWIAKLLTLSGNDIFRMKGVLAMAGLQEKFVYQGVHMQFKGEFAEPWKEGETRNCKLIFIGRNLDREMLTAGFDSCRNIVEYILEEDIAATTLRFRVGDAVLCKTGEETYTPGMVAAIFHKEPHLPPGKVVPYQVKLEGGGSVYVPADVDAYIMLGEGKGARAKDRETLEAEEARAATAAAALTPATATPTPAVAATAKNLAASLFATATQGEIK